MFEVYAFSIVGSLIVVTALVIYMKLLHLEMLINKEKKQEKEDGK